MGSTLDALNSRSGVQLLYTVIIEGFPYILTNDNPEVALLAYSDSNTSVYPDDFESAIGGLSIDWDTEQRLTPWKPFPAPNLVRFTVVPAGTAANPSVVSDIVGQTIFKRVPANQSELRADVDCNDTSVTVARADDFAASGTLYVGGLEAATYSSRDTGTDVFTVSQRGKYPAVLTTTGNRWARTVKPLVPTEHDAGVSPIVTSEPTVWVGRWCAIWVHRVVGGVPDTVEADQSAAHCMFVGTIASVSDADGATVFEALDVRQKIYGTRVLRDQFRARVAEGVELTTGMQFAVLTERTSNTADTVGQGDPLVVVASGAVSPGEINAGRYSAAELGEKITAWLQGERIASRILFNVTYQGVWSDADGSSRGRITVRDPTVGSGSRRAVSVVFPSEQVSRFMGWAGDSIFGNYSLAAWELLSPDVPLRFRLDPASHSGTALTLTEARGEWISQAAYLPVSLQNVFVGWDGIVKFGSFGYARAKYTSDTSISVSGEGCEAWFPGSGNVTDAAGRQYTVDDDVSLDITQILVMEGNASNIMLRLLLSTGTANFNSTSYDNLEESASCVVPFSALGAGFVEEMIATFTGSLCMIVREPTAWHQLFEADFILRRAFLVWAAGRLRIKQWATPTSGYAAFALDETSKSVEPGTRGLDVAATEQADYYNLVTIRFNVDADGNYRDSLTLKDAVSIRAHGERAIEIKARNTFRQVGAVGSPIDELVSEFAGFFSFTSRPWTVIRRSIDQNYLEQAYPGVVLTLTDKAVRNPETGLRYDNRAASGGLSGYPGFVIGHRIDLGGPDGGVNGSTHVRKPSGEVDIMISPQKTIPVYVPCAEVDETAPSAGYIAGTKVLTLKAHAHSESSEAADASHFPATSQVRVIEIDPVNPAAPQIWGDVVASQTGNTITLTTGLAGYDTTGATLYRVIFADFITATAAQKTKAYQADDADGMIANLAQSYAFGSFGSSQSTTVTLSTGQEIPSRYTTSAYGDGLPFDVGYEQDIVRLANNLIHYKTAPQQPTVYSEVRDFTGAGTWQLVEVMPFFVGMGEFTAGRTRLLSVAPRIRSTSGATATVRVTCARRMPSGSTRDDITRVGPYTEATFTTTSTTAVISTAQTLDIGHVRLSDTLLGGVLFLLIEVKTATEFTGLARLKLGAVA